METVDECDTLSQSLLNHVRDATYDLKGMMDVKNQERRDSSDTTYSECVVNATATENTYTHNATRLLQSESSLLKETEFSNHLLGSKTTNSSSTPISALKRHSAPTQESQMHEMQNHVEPEELWSVDSKPVALAHSKGSSAGDFHQVEAVLPKAQQLLNVEAIRRKVNYEEDDLSDSSQSHTVFTIAKLVSDLNNQRKRNKVLEDRIRSLENDLSAAKIQYDVEQLQRNETETGQLSSLVEEIYHAQKERESAMLARLKLAIQERDEAVLRAKAVLKDSSCLDARSNLKAADDVTLNELMDTVCEAESGRATEKHGRSVFDRISKLKEERDRITSEEMGAVIAERNNALHKCRLLSEEIKRYKEKLSDHETASEHKQNAVFQMNLSSLQEDKDAALQKLGSVQEEMETLRIYYSLHKSLAESGRMAVEQAEHDDAQRLVKALRVAQEHNRVQEANTRRHESEVKRLREKNERLERLVNVLRRKLSLLAQKSANTVSNAALPSHKRQ